MSKSLNSSLTDSHIQDESKMRKVDLSNQKDNQDFAFMKQHEDEFTALEWEQRERELDRAWYDADEDSNIRYGDGGDPFESFLGGKSAEEEKAATEELLKKKK